jgi:hypothetical protein
MRIDSSGNVLVNDGYVKFSENSSVAYIGASDTLVVGGSASDTAIRYDSSNLVFSYSSSEKMRIDSSGNLLVGTTNGNVGNSSATNDGIFMGSGSVIAGRTSNLAAIFNRRSTDGSIAEFRKDGTTVGSIGSASGATIYIDGGSQFAGLQFGGDGASEGRITPRRNGASADAATDLGTSSLRFKDLYLSNSVQIHDAEGQQGRFSVFGNSTYLMSATDLQFRTGGLNAADEAMRIDSSGNVLVGTTTNDAWYTSSNEGHNLNSGNFLAVARSGGTSFIANRLGTDGDAYEVRKNGTIVGSIGVASLRPTFVSDGGLTYDAGFRLYGSNTSGAQAIHPYDGSGSTDGLLDLGRDSSRFKDLYLSGGVYLGGAVAANKLDDYEESSFALNTASDATGSLDGNSYGYYVKVGSMVTVQVVFQCNANFTSNKIGDLPFVPINHSTVISTLHGGGVIFYGSSRGFVRVSNNDTKMYFTDTSGAAVNPSTTNDPFRFTITYRTS